HQALHRHGGCAEPVPVAVVLGRRRHRAAGVREAGVSTKVSGPPRPGPIRRLPSWLKGLVAVVVVAVLMYGGLRWAYGGFGNYYYLTADVARAGQQMEVGSDVRMSGVVVGKVSDIRLVNRHVQLRLQMDQQYHVPADADAVN